jgi:phosphoribosylamine--glycine ligase
MMINCDIPLLTLKIGAQLEGSKEFAKEFCEHNIPTAAYDSFTAETVEKGCDFLETLKPLCFESGWSRWKAF